MSRKKKELDSYDKLLELCRKYREFLKLTQADIGVRTNYQYNNISAFERGAVSNSRLLCYYIKYIIPITELEDWKYDD